MKDEKLDKIFQEAAMGAYFGDGANGWNSLKSKLDQEMVLPKENNRKSFKWSWFLLIALLFIAGTGLVWVLVGNNNSSPESVAVLEQDRQKSTNIESVIKDKEENQRIDADEADKGGAVESGHNVSSDMKGITENIIVDGVDHEETTGSSESINTEVPSINKSANESSDVVKEAKQGLGAAVLSGDRSKKNSKTVGQKSLSQTTTVLLPNDRKLKKNTTEGAQAEPSVIDKNQQKKSYQETDINDSSDLQDDTKVEPQLTETSDKTIIKDQIEEGENELLSTEAGANVDKSENHISESVNYSLSIADLIENGNNSVSNQNSQNLVIADGAEQSENKVEEENKSNQGAVVDMEDQLFEEGQSVTSSKENKQLVLLDPKGLSLLEVDLDSLSPKFDLDEVAKIQSEYKGQQEIIAERSKWSVGIEFAPDLSGAGITKVEDSGFNLGLNIEYHLTSKLSINSGLTYAKKLYFAEQGIESYRTNPLWELDRVNANCDVIDIPINLNYYVAGHQRSGFMFSAGLSTYFMLTEKYDILYEQPWPGQEVTIRNENKLFLGLFNASVGYKKILSPTLSLKAEPFVKIPLQGIGDGNIDLFTSGFKLTLKYNQININR